MRTILHLTIICILSLAVGRAQGEKDVDGSQDHPLLSRMPGYYISAYEPKDFDVFESPYVSGADAKWEGKLTKIGYTMKSGTKPVSMTQIALNYKNAVKKLGGKILSDDGRVISGKITKGKGVTYVQVAAFNDGRDYELLLVESKPMDQEVTVDAAALNQSIAATGKAAVYGIYFDTGKSVIKSESAPAMEEIVKLLKEHFGLKLYVVGHTDFVGSLESNLKLSADRASAVVKALIGQGIDGSRLKAAGVGPYSPEASNRTEEGKAKNRRVELVEQG
jgi:OmpA-OmpF porin, OOP family